MAEIFNDVEELIKKDEKLIDIWGRRTPKFEKKYELSVLRPLSNYGVGSSEDTELKGKILGAGYEPYIMAFFIGLYANKRIPLSDDNKVLGYPLEKWGDREARKERPGRNALQGYMRHQYANLRSYIFIALVAKSEVDWIALDKGEIKVSAVISSLVKTMEEYANYGFSLMEEKLKEDKGYFFSNRAFLDLFLQLTEKDDSLDDESDLPEEL